MATLGAAAVATFHSVLWWVSELPELEVYEKAEPVKVGVSSTPVLPPVEPAVIVMVGVFTKSKAVAVVNSLVLSADSKVLP